MSYCYGGIVVYQPGEVLGPRLLTDFEAVLIIEGRPRYETSEGILELEPGSVLLGQPGTTETYHWDSKDLTRHAYLHFDLDAIPEDWPPLSAWPRCRLQPPAIIGQMLRHLVERAIEHPDWPSQPPDGLDERLMESFVDLFLADDPGRGDTPPTYVSEPVRRAVKFMRERLDSPAFVPFSLDELAAASLVTNKHLCRAFTKELGVPPMKACRLMQFQLAVPLLARSNLTIKQIAERCGFPDQLHFSRSFKQAFGAPPSEVRQSMAAGEPPPTTSLPPGLMPRMYW